MILSLTPIVSSVSTAMSLSSTDSATCSPWQRERKWMKVLVLPYIVGNFGKDLNLVINFGEFSVENLNLCDTCASIASMIHNI